MWRLERSLRCALVSITLSLTVACSPAEGGPEPHPQQETDEMTPAGAVSCLQDPRLDSLAPTRALSKLGDDGELTFVLLPLEEESLVRGENELQLRVLHDGVEVADAELEVSATMPDHGHGTRSEPSVRFDEAHQAYSISDLDLFMPGVWRIDVTCPAQAMGDGAQGVLDTTAYHFCVEG